MSDVQNQPVKTNRATRPDLIWILAGLVAVLTLFGYVSYIKYSSRAGVLPVSTDLSPEALDHRLLIAEQSVASLTRERNDLQQRLTESANRTNLLRDEVLGISERAGLIEQNLRDLSSSEHSAQDSLRISEAELLLTLARERWLLTGDLLGTIQATELAGTSISSLKDPQWVNLRQTIGQELAALRAVGEDPRATAKGELDALEALLPQLAPLSSQSTITKSNEHGATRLLNALIRIQPTGQQTLISPSERSAAKTALALEFANARMALQLRNSGDFKTSVLHINQWLLRLYADTPQLKESRGRLLAAANVPLIITSPLAGSSLAELQRMTQGTTR